MAATKELQSIVAARTVGRPAALVTVVKTAGSSYRQPGARMLVDDTGFSVGSISGGCLEDDAREQAIAVIASGQPTLVRYDTTADGDIIFGSGLGCQGVVHVLVEPLPAPGGSGDPLAHVARALSSRRRGVLASVCAVEAPGDISLPPVVLPRLGNHVWFEQSSPDDESIPATGRPLDGVDPAAVARDAHEALRRGRSQTHSYILPFGGRVEIFYDLVSPARSLLICGAGPDAVPLAHLGKELGWRVRVVDGRKAYAVPEKFPGVDELIVCPPVEFAERVPVEAGEAVVLMTHNYLHDRNLLRALLSSPVGYIGLLGPRRRTDRLLADLAKSADPVGALGSRSLRRLHGPAGLDIGAESPEQIALAIIAEAEAFYSRRRGGVLRRRRTPLHGTTRS